MSGVTEVLARWMFEAEWGGEWEDCHESARPGWIRSAQATVDFLSTVGFGLTSDAEGGSLDAVMALVERAEIHGNYIIYTHDVRAALDPKP